MAKFDIQALKKQIAHVVEIHKEMHHETCDALNSSSSDRHHKYEDVMALYMRKSILVGQIEMAKRVIYMIEQQEAKGNTKNVRKTV